jgi:hypothetical protein
MMATALIQGSEWLEPFLDNQLVIVTVYRYISGNSSVPFSEPIDEVIGTLKRVGDTAFELREDGDTVARISGVYRIGEGFHGKAHIEGWLAGDEDGFGRRWGQWMVYR